MDQAAEGGGEGKMRQGAALLRGLSSGTAVHSCCAGPCARPGGTAMRKTQSGLRELRCQWWALTQDGTGDTNSTAALSVRHLPPLICTMSLRPETLTVPILGMRRPRLSDVK